MAVACDEGYAVKVCITGPKQLSTAVQTISAMFAFDAELELCLGLLTCKLFAHRSNLNTHPCTHDMLYSAVSGQHYVQ